MQLWRISEFRSLSGEGGMLYSARWHTKGRPVVYLASSPAGAMLEVLVHLELDEGRIPRKYTLLQILYPDDLLTAEPAGSDLSTVWRNTVGHSRQIGDDWLLQRETALARVPSSIVPYTWNFLLNPLHADAARLEIISAVTGEFDPRLLGAR